MSACRVAPPGFSPEQWREFRERRGPTAVRLGVAGDPEPRAAHHHAQLYASPRLHHPSADDFPLFLNRETGADTDAGVPDRIPLRLRTRRTAAERFTTERGGDR